jgi:hypothetical protein
MNEYLNKIKQELVNNNSSSQTKIITEELIEVNIPQVKYPFYLRKHSMDEYIYKEVFV